MAWLAAHGKKLLAVVAGFVLLVPFMAGAVGGEDTLFVAVNAPQAEDHATVYVGLEKSLLGSCPDQAEVEITRDGLIVYPGVLGQIDLEGCEGTIEIPYRKFADRNGGYTVHVEVGDRTAQTRVNVEKVVNWVYIRSFPNETEERTRVEVALSRSMGQPLQSSVFTSGELVLDVYWEDCSSDSPLGVGLIANQTQDCQADHDNVFHGTVPLNTTAATNVIIPWDNFQSEKYGDEQPAEGSYNVTATFHNVEAKGNKNVPMDPTVFHEDPPGNWFEVTYE